MSRVRAATKSGGIEGGAMVLTAGDGARPRMTYSREAGGGVRQLVDQSTDRRASWTAQYDFTYRPAALPAQAG